MKCSYEWLFAVGFAGALSACQPLPHPFETDHRAPESALMALPEVVGIVVDPIQGAAEAPATALQQNLTKALQDADIPASTDSGASHSYHVSGDASRSIDSGKTVTASIVWIVTAADGTEIGRDVQHFAIDHAGWQGNGTVLANLMQAEALRLAGVLHLPTAAPASPEPPPPPHAAVTGVTGAPGDGDQSLPRALSYVLQNEGVTVSDRIDADAVRVSARVTIRGRPDRQQDVRIVWTVADSDGRVVGTVAQENAVPRGSLDGPWSDAAAAVAAAAGDSIRGLIMQAMQASNRAP